MHTHTHTYLSHTQACKPRWRLAQAAEKSYLLCTVSEGVAPSGGQLMLAPLQEPFRKKKRRGPLALSLWRKRGYCPCNSQAAVEGTGNARGGASSGGRGLPRWACLIRSGRGIAGWPISSVWAWSCWTAHILGEGVASLRGRGLVGNGRGFVDVGMTLLGRRDSRCGRGLAGSRRGLLVGPSPR